MTPYEHLVLSFEGPIARITLNRPKALNALSMGLLAELLAAIRAAEEYADARLLVLEGQGRAFCGGFDLQGVASLFMGGGGPKAETLRPLAVMGEEVVTALDSTRLVTIASVHGYAIGGGFLLMSACDLRVVTEDTVCAIPEVDIGLPLVWGGVPLLVRELGPSLARDLVMTCRRFRPRDLPDTGFFHRLVDADNRVETVAALAKSLGAKPALALSQTKQQFLQRDGRREGRCDADLALEALMDPAFLPNAMRYLQGLRGKRSQD